VVTSELEQRVVGSVVGLAAGAPARHIVGARNLVRSLGERNGFDAEDLINRHLERFRAGAPFGGGLTGMVLERIEQGVFPEEAARLVWEERGPEVSAGNGSVLTSPPLGVAYANRSQLLQEFAPALSRLTHWDRRCQTACFAVASATAGLVRGEDPEGAVHRVLERAIDQEGGEELEFLVEAVGTARRVDGPDRTFCLYTAAVGLQTALRAGSFEEGMSRVAGLGGDTETNGAVAGALLGARFGRDAIPPSTVDGLDDVAGIEEEARALVPLASTR
jgi:ADP-ribosyl-[dinitrogen reductase] hydrolase